MEGEGEGVPLAIRDTPSPSPPSTPKLVPQAGVRPTRVFGNHAVLNGGGSKKPKLQRDRLKSYESFETLESSVDMTQVVPTSDTDDDSESADDNEGIRAGGAFSIDSLSTIYDHSLFGSPKRLNAIHAEEDAKCSTEHTLDRSWKYRVHEPEDDVWNVDDNQQNDEHGITSSGPIKCERPEKRLTFKPLFPSERGQDKVLSRLISGFYHKSKWIYSNSTNGQKYLGPDIRALLYKMVSQSAGVTEKALTQKVYPSVTNYIEDAIKELIDRYSSMTKTLVKLKDGFRNLQPLLKQFLVDVELALTLGSIYDNKITRTMSPEDNADGDILDLASAMGPPPGEADEGGPNTGSPHHLHSGRGSPSRRQSVISTTLASPVRSPGFHSQIPGAEGLEMVFFENSEEARFLADNIGYHYSISMGASTRKILLNQLMLIIKRHIPPKWVDHASITTYMQEFVNKIKKDFKLARNKLHVRTTIADEVLVPLVCAALGQLKLDAIRKRFFAGDYSLLVSSNGPEEKVTREEREEFMADLIAWQSNPEVRAGKVKIKVKCANDVPRDPSHALKGSSYVRVKVQNHPTEWTTRTIRRASNPLFDESFDLPFVHLDDIVEVALMNSVGLCMGQTTLTLRELIHRPSITLLVQYSDGTVLLKRSKAKPCTLTIDIEKVPSYWPQPAFEEKYLKPFPKHVFLMTRGTRGDVQPFIALARGLAEILGWMVTICTELRFKSFVKSHSKVSRGAIRFRPTGGDTTSRIEEPVCRMAVCSKSELLQMAMLAWSEFEFFDSEAVIYYWLERMLNDDVNKPSLIVFGFTLTSIAMIMSETFHLPMLGFILQPSCIPSENYQAVTPITTSKFAEKYTGHSMLSWLKNLSENNLLTQPLNNLRKKRGLASFSTNKSLTWEMMIAQNVPILVPINEICFGGKPRDWSENTVLSDFIFLRGGETQSLSARLQSFIDKAKLAHAPLVVMAFSSMPVSRDRILEIAIKMISECKWKPRIICLAGPTVENPLSESLLEKRNKFEEEGTLFEAQGASFGILFDLVDCLIIHGGLGTTAEALRAGLPTIVTGVLLMDQRFWGRRVNELGVGPPPVHITNFQSVCVDYLDDCLRPENEYIVNCKALTQRIKATSADGVPENVEHLRLLADKWGGSWVKVSAELEAEARAQARARTKRMGTNSRSASVERVKRESSPAPLRIMATAQSLNVKSPTSRMGKHNVSF